MSGLCGAQLLEIEGKKGNQKFIPHLLGHEGIGLVSALGAGVSKFRVGDRVVMHWRKGSGAESPAPKYVTNSGISVGAGQVAPLSTESVVSENRLTKVDGAFPDELGALLGCALTTAFGVVDNELQLKSGDSVAVLGAGGVGLSLLAALSLKGLSSIYVIERSSFKQSIAIALGATEFCQALEADVSAIIDTTGSDVLVGQSIMHLEPGGQLVLMTEESRGIGFSSPNQPLFRNSGITVLSSQGGRSMPDFDIPKLAKFLYEREALWRPLVTHVLPLEDVNLGLDLLRSGNAGRVMIRMRASVEH
jgi:S-(hydroxymethyl)glutathione dehydrogenase/alcohol dehydrogenase